MEKILKEKIEKILTLKELHSGVSEQLRWLEDEKSGGGIVTSDRVKKGLPETHDKIKALAIELYKQDLVQIETKLDELIK